MSKDKKSDPENAWQVRRPYEKPAVVSEEVFETLALACSQSTFGTCGGGVSS